MGKLSCSIYAVLEEWLRLSSLSAQRECPTQAGHKRIKTPVISYIGQVYSFYDISSAHVVQILTSHQKPVY